MPTIMQAIGNDLVLAKPNVIMNDIRLRGLAVAGSDAAGRKTVHNHAQTVRNLKRSLRNAAAGARLIQQRGWTANRLPRSQPPLPMPSKSFTGSSAASTDVPDATRDASFPVSSFTRRPRVGPVLFRKDGGSGLVGGGLHRGGVARQDESVGDAAVERSLPLVEIRLPVGVALMQFRGGERSAVPEQRLEHVAVVPPAVLTGGYREVGEPDAAECVAVLVAPNPGWVGRLKFDASLRRWRRAALDPSVEVVECSAVGGCVTQDVWVL